MTDEAGAIQPAGDPPAELDWSEGGTVLAFVNEVAGGRKLLEGVRARVERGADRVAVAAPQNQPAVGQLVDVEELREAALSRVEVTQGVLEAFGIESVGAVMDPDPALALDDAIRAFEPREVLLSCLYETRFGFLRRDLVEWAKQCFETPITHVPVRIDDDAVRWDVTHTLVIATQTVASGDLIGHLKRNAGRVPHRYTIVCPPSGELSREQICARLATTLAAMYREGIDATGQPMSPAPLVAVENAIRHYRIDEVLISTLADEHSPWLEAGLVERVRELTEMPVKHVEAGREPVAATIPTEPQPAASG